MVKPVVLTPLAKENLENITDYLFREWGISVLENFLALYEAKISLITEYPERYPVIHVASGLRKAVLTKHNTILYRERADRIEIISVFDTRQDPRKLEQFI